MASTTQHIARRYRETNVVTDVGLTVLVQAHDETLDTPATIECLRADAGAAHELSDLAQAFMRAGHHVKRIVHPNVARVLDVIEDAEPALVFERLEAQTLEDHVNALPHLIEPDVAVRWGSAICDALACLHGHSPPLMHLDMKPSNLLLTRDGRLVLTGFGLLREANERAAPVALLTGAGTPGYASPEQFEGSSIDARADLYALGATLYAALTRRTPPDARELRDGRARWEPPEMHNPQVSPALSQAIRVLMSASRDARPNTAEEARELLSPRREIAATPRPTGTDDAGDAARSTVSTLASQRPTPAASIPTEKADPAPLRSGSRLASVLFIDIASYSTYRNDEQIALRRALDRMISNLSCLSDIDPGDIYFDLRAGDSAVLAFTNHLSAPVDAALELTRAAREPIDGTLTVSLRMGLHVGAITFDHAGHAVGEALNMGQRVASAGEPGDITASQTYTDMLAADTNRYDRFFGPAKRIEIKHGRQLEVCPVGDSPPIRDHPIPASPAPEPNLSMPPVDASPSLPVHATVTRPMPTSALPTTPPASGVTLIITEGAQAGRRLALPAATVELGRGDAPEPSSTRVEIAERTISRVQGTLRYDQLNRAFTLVHNPSATNVTVVNNCIVNQHTLSNGDEIRVGQLAMRVAAIDNTPPAVSLGAQVHQTLPFGRDVTGQSNFTFAFVLRVTGGLPSDCGKAFPIAESALTTPHRLTLGGPGTRDNDITLSDPAVSNRHAVLTTETGTLRIAGEDPSRPPSVNGQPVVTSRLLTHGDIITVGHTQLRFESSAPPPRAAACLEVTSAGTTTRHILPVGSIRLGRLAPCEILIADPSVSRVHASLEVSAEGRCVARHESATNPTLLNGLPLVGQKTLEDGDVLQLSQTTSARFTWADSPR